MWTLSTVQNNKIGEHLAKKLNFYADDTLIYIYIRCIERLCYVNMNNMAALTWRFASARSFLLFMLAHWDI